MHRTDAVGATPENQFTDGNPAVGTPATTVGAKFMNTLQEELAGFIEAQGIVLDDEDDAQLAAAIAVAIAAAVPSAPDASTTVKGIVELATDAETQTGTDGTRAVTPASLASKVASTTANGLVELATNAEAVTGTDAMRAVTPAGLAAAVPSASTSAKGKVELATDAETQTGTDGTRAVTPAALASVVASATARGLVELATNAETQAGSDSTRAVTPAGGAASYARLTADNTFSGDIKIGASGAAIEAILSTTATIDFGSAPAQSFSSQDVTVTGVPTGSKCAVIVTPSSGINSRLFDGNISAANTVRVYYHNYTGGAVDPPSDTYRITVIVFA